MNRESDNRSFVAGQPGFSLLDVMAARVLLAIVTIAIALNSTTASRTLTVILRKSIAFNLATDKLESLKTIDPSKLDDTYDSRELDLTVSNFHFQREADITTNGDGSRSITVVVTPAGRPVIEPVRLQTTLVEWGSK
jgi:hypothetical protein